tara:strand:- start:502 stop:795 length:294 start_codon:yes stop_codon:yes gene_type:complete
MQTTYAIPFITKNSPHKTIYWTIYNDLSGGFFCTVDEVVPLASLLTNEECAHVWEYLDLHGLLCEGATVTACKDKKEYIKALGKPVITKLNIPKIVW